jgi:hypothetical protein
VIAGDVLIVPDAGDFSTVSIPAGVTARISDVVDDKFTVTHLSGTGVITVTVDGVPVEIAPGGESGEFVTVNPDVTPPVVTGVVTPAANDAGWNNTPVVIDWISIDPQPSSGVPTDPPDSQVAAEGEAIEVVSQPSCDPSGNCATGSTVVNIDLTDPVVSIDGVVDGQVFDIGQAPTPSCTTVDPLAGVGQAATVSIEGGNPDGSGVYTVTCDGGTDLAGNQAPAVTATFEVHYLLAPNTFTGGSVDPAPVVNTGKAGRTYPVRWTLTDADGNRITNVAAVTSIRHRRVDCDC